MKLSEYTPGHEGACLSIFDGNTPPFFAVQERELFAGYLKKVSPPYYYFLVRDNDEAVLACGGMNFEAPNHLAYLRWDMVSRDFQRRGAGSFLVLSRLALICQVPDIQTVLLGTSQYSYRFYEKMGFATRRITPDGIAPGLDEYIMGLELDGEMRNKLEGFLKEKAVS